MKMPLIVLSLLLMSACSKEHYYRIGCGNIIPCMNGLWIKLKIPHLDINNFNVDIKILDKAGKKRTVRCSSQIIHPTETSEAVLSESPEIPQQQNLCSSAYRNPGEESPVVTAYFEDFQETNVDIELTFNNKVQHFHESLNYRHEENRAACYKQALPPCNVAYLTLKL